MGDDGGEIDRGGKWFGPPDDPSVAGTPNDRWNPEPTLTCVCGYRTDPDAPVVDRRRSIAGHISYHDSTASPERDHMSLATWRSKSRFKKVCSKIERHVMRANRPIPSRELTGETGMVAAIGTQIRRWMDDRAERMSILAGIVSVLTAYPAVTHQAPGFGPQSDEIAAMVIGVGVLLATAIKRETDWLGGGKLPKQVTERATKARKRYSKNYNTNGKSIQFAGGAALALVVVAIDDYLGLGLVSEGLIRTLETALTLPL